MLFSKRLCISTGGQISVSSANLLMSVVMMVELTPDDFGAFSFINIVIFLGFGVSNALLSSPLMIALHRNNNASDEVVESYFLASVVLGLMLLCIILSIAYIMTYNIGLAFLYGATAFFLFITRLARTYFYDKDEALHVLLSDCGYSLVIFIGIGLGVMLSQISLIYVVGLMSLSAFFSFVLLGSDVFKRQWRGMRFGNWKPFIDGVCSQGKHALVGVLTTEATGRGHAYIVTALLGPAAFAPIAVATTFFRPVNLVMFSLTQFERGRLARLLRDHKNAQAWSTLNFFYLAGALAWLANIALAFIIMIFFASDFFGSKYDLQVLSIGILFYALISLFLCLRSPLSSLLQANADFKYLKNVTIVSSLVALPIVTAMVVWTGAVWSLVGVATGELVAVILIYQLALKRVKKHGKVIEK